MSENSHPMMSEDFCEGFIFRYFQAVKSQSAVECQKDEHFMAAENHFLWRVSDVLKNRPDVMTDLACMDNGLEVHLYKGTAFEDFEDENYFYGRVTVDGDITIMEMSTEEVLKGAQADHNVLDVIVHELIHAIDFLDYHDGLLPEWSEAEITQFEEARATEQVKIKEGTSPMDSYALVSDIEFLAVAGETFFVKGQALKESNPMLYQLFEDFFLQSP